MEVINNLKSKVIVSVQAMPNEPLYEEVCMAAMMQSVINGGAQGLRVAGARDVKIAKRLFKVPVIGLTKPDKLPENWLEVVYITPSMADIEALIDAGADVIAFDGTSRDRACPIEKMIKRIHDAGRLAMADIATFDDAKKCADLGADLVSTTLSGYTKETKSDSQEPDFGLLQRLVKELSVPVILEGRIWEPYQVKNAFEFGAYCVVIGSAITRPQLITNRFINYASD